MGVDVSKLTPSPSVLQAGVTNVTMSFYGIVDAAEDNAVSLKLYVDPSLPVFFIEKGNQKKVLSIKKTISHSDLAIYTWNVDIEVVNASPEPVACSLRLEATDSKGYKSSTNSFFIYH
ncbi:hypothetical protein [Flavobacterium panici]|uniref:Uncharacterized protein n=1 Tax=Flavobacterium panici TaxID=2654843 RepID=A0A9N8J4M6_9FLAO|nr:hypothetical protein [Flavobacterium panici]CAC9975937.1 hypothetical protein FLAPXU55_03658 [Flavobacterium panici]